MDEIDKVAANFAKYPPRPPAPSSPDGSSSDNGASLRPPPIYTDGSKIPTIVCGDFNSSPDSGVYEFLSTGSLPPDHPDWMQYTYGKYTQDGLRHKFGLKSAYAAVGELPMTNCTPTFKEPIDYIWYSTSSLAVNAVLGEVDKSYMDKVVGFPNHHFPSEYVPFIISISTSRLIIYPQSLVHSLRVPCQATEGVATSASAPSLPGIVSMMLLSIIITRTLSPHLWSYIYTSCKYAQLRVSPPFVSIHNAFYSPGTLLPRSPCRSLVEYRFRPTLRLVPFLPSPPRCACVA